MNVHSIKTETDDSIDNIKTELLVTNYSIVPQTPLELALS